MLISFDCGFRFRRVHQPYVRSIGLVAAMITAVAILSMALLTPDGFSKTIPKRAPSSPPSGYTMVVPCHAQLGQLWAPPGSSQPPTGTEPPMLGFFQGQLTGMVFYLSEHHIAPSRANKAGWAFGGEVNTTIDAISIAPAQLRPHRDNRAYEITMLVHHDQPITVTCASSNAPATSQGGGNLSNQGGGGSGDTSGGTGGVTKHPKK